MSTISEAFELYRTDCIAFRNQSTKTEEMSKCAERSLIAFFGDVDIECLTFTDIRKWKQYLDKGRSVNTVRGYIVKLRVMLAYLARRGYKVVPVEDIPVPKRQTTMPSFLTPAQVTTLIDGVGKPRRGVSRILRARAQAIISLLYGSGIRNSELCSLDRSDIYEEYSTFTVIGKGGVMRPCFIDDRTRKYLNIYLKLRRDNEAPLFISELSKKRITSETVREIFKSASRLSGITTHISPHTMRHSFATNLMRNRADIRYVQKFLGHRSIQTTEMYTHVLDEDLRRVYEESHTI